IAEAIIAESHVYRLSNGRASQMISWDPDSGLYRIQTERLELEVQVRLGETTLRTVKDYHVQEVMKAIRRNAPLMESNDLNSPARDIIVFRNGILDLRTMCLIPHSPEFLYTIGIPHNYNPNASCPKFDEFIRQILPSDAHHLIKQLLGYLLTTS